MIINTIKTSGCQPQTIVIGRRGTYDTMQIAFDLSYLVESYGNGVAVLAVKRSQDESAYPAVTTQADNTLTWTVSETDTAYVGAGECQLMWYVDGGLAKTIIYPMAVMRDILATSEEAPDAYQTWVDDLTALGAETLQNAQNAARSASDAESAKDDAVTAKEAAEEAAKTAQEAVVHAPIIQNGYWYIWNDGQYVDTGVRAEGQKGDKGDTGEKGDTGNGIASITKTGTSGLVDTYTVTYTDGTTTTFTVTNGAKGDKGDTGATGNGIQSITKTGTSGNVDTYTITYTNGQTTTFTVTNGAVSSVNGKTGAVNLASGDIAYDESATYQNGSVGAELQEQTRHLSDLEDTVSTTQIINTASGAIASFSDGADSMPIRKLVAQIEPVQDLHGYANPWTGGGGKNKFPVADWFTAYDVSANYLIVGNTSVYVPAGTYTLSFEYYIDGITTAQSFCRTYSEKVTSVDASKQIEYKGLDLQVSATTWTERTVTFTLQNAGWFGIDNGQLRGGVHYRNIQLESGSSKTSFAPYENICPISGHTGAEIEQTGANVWDEEWENGTFNTTTGANINTGATENQIRAKNLIPIKPSATYYFKDPSGIWCIFYDANKNVITPPAYDRNVIAHDGNSLFLGDAYRPASVTFTMPSNAYFMKFYCQNVYGSTYNNDISINYPVTATAYEPYTGNQISVNWETEAGTVYGGKATLNNDGSVDLVAAWTSVILKNLSASGFWIGTKSVCRRWTLIDNAIAVANAGVYRGAKSNMAEEYPAYYGAPRPNEADHNVFAITLEGTIVAVYDPDLTLTEETITAKFAEMQVVYPLATSRTYHFDNIGQLQTFLGTNNIWSSTGDTEVEYPCDTKLYIDGKLAELQATILENIGG